MKKEDFCEVIGDIKDSYVREACLYKRRWNRVEKMKFAAMAACACMVICAGFICYVALQPKDFSKKLIDLSSFLPKTTHAEERMLFIDIDERTAIYTGSSEDSDKLKDFVGILYQQQGSAKFYYPKDYDNLKYLIMENQNGEFSLWIFDSFDVPDGETYTYGEVLSTIYNVTSASDIVSIKTTPSRSNNLGTGLQAQKKVGNKTYKDREDIEKFYEIIKNVKCFGFDSVSIADSDRFKYSFSTNSEDKFLSGESTLATRCIEITLKDGTTISSWIYNALSGAFYEYGGIFSEPLPDEEVYKLNQIFGIQ